MPDDRLPKLLLLAVLILIQGLLNAAEAALAALPEARLRHQAEEGDETARALLALTRPPERFRAAVRAACSLAGLLSAVLAAGSLAQALTAWLREICGPSFLPDPWLRIALVALLILLLAYISLVLGYLFPRRLAARRPEAVARGTLGAARAVYVLFRPAAWLLDKSANGVLRLCGVDPNAPPSDVSEDEIRMMVDKGEERGAIEPAEKELIENIFEFNNTTAEDVMIHRTDMTLLWLEDTPEEILALIRESGLSRFPVYNEDADDIIGILNTREYLLNTQEDKPLPLRELLRPAYFVPESVRTDVLFRDMQSKKIHMAIVVDEYGGTSGLVTMEDLLEEIVGNIYDEFDPQEEKEIIPMGDNLWKIAGSAELEAVAEALDIRLPEDEASDTLGGLVFAQLSVIPEDGSKFEVDALGLHIRVEDFTDHRVEWTVVSKLEPPKEEV